MSPNDLSVLNKHTGMQHNTPFNPPPQSDFPFGPCQQNTGVHLLTWTAPAADPQRLQGSWTHWENTTTPEHLFFSCDNNVIRRLLYCFSTQAERVHGGIVVVVVVVVVGGGDGGDGAAG